MGKITRIVYLIMGAICAFTVILIPVALMFYVCVYLDELVDLKKEEMELIRTKKK